MIAEVAYILGRRGGAELEAAFLVDLASGAFLAPSLEHADFVRAAELVARYSDLRLGSVDAIVVATAERLGITTIATLDHRHFSVVRPAHTDRFTLVP